MSTGPDTTPAESGQNSELGFELKKRRRWPWVLGAVVVVVAVAAAIVIPILNPAKSADAVAGATLYVATAEGNASEQALVNFVAAKVAPKFASR